MWMEKDCPFCKNEEEDQDGNHQNQFQQKDTQQMNSFQAQNMKQTIPQTSQPTQTQTFNVPDKYMKQICLRKEWEKKMERLNDKYNLDYFSGSELDSESDEGEDYRFQHHYEMLI